MTDFVADVRAFHERFGVPVKLKPELPGADRLELGKKLIDEEVNRELLPAIEEALFWIAQGVEPPHMCMLKIADGIIDSMYVLIGRGLEFGIPMERVWEVVQAANLAKEADPNGGKVRKPKGWIPPDVARALWGER